MKTLLIIALFLLCLNANAENTGAAESATATNSPKDKANESATVKVQTEAKKFKLPTLKEVAMEIKEKQGGLPGKAYLHCLKLLKLDSELNIKNFFDRFREIDKSVYLAKKSPALQRYLKESKTSSFRKKHAKLKADKGEHFIIVYPEYISVSKSRDAEKKSTDEVVGISEILSKADSAFDETAKLLMIDKFINWSGKIQGKIFIVTDETLWRSVRPGSAKPRPDQIIVTKDKYREFFVYINPDTFDSAPEAVAFAVAQLVLKEYSKAVSRKPESKFPLFYLSGVAFNISGLDSVIFEDGPKQLKKWNEKEITTKAIRSLRKRDGELKQLPLSKNSLIDFKKMILATSYPRHGEDVYYFARQSAALIKYLHENGQIPFLVMSRMLAKGDAFNNAFEDGYVDLRDKLSGKKKDKKPKKIKRSKKDKKDKKSRRELKKEQEKAKEAKDTLAGFKELADQAKEVIFFPLTKEYLKGEMMDKKRSSKRRKR